MQDAGTPWLAQRWGSDMNASSLSAAANPERRRFARPALAAGMLIAAAVGLSGCKSESAPYVAAPQPVRAASVTLSAAIGCTVVYRHHQGALRERSRLPRSRQDRRAPRQHRRSGHARHDARPARRDGLPALARVRPRPSSRLRRAASNRPRPTKRAMRLSTKRPGSAPPATTRRRPPRMRRAAASSGPFGPFHSPRTSSPIRISSPRRPASSLRFRSKSGRWLVPAN